MELSSYMGDHDDDEGSENSTVIHGHESYETFQHKVMTLFRNLGLTPIACQRLLGGSYNRVIAVDCDPEESFIIRIPRVPNPTYDGSIPYPGSPDSSSPRPTLHDRVRVLQHIGSNADVAVPRIVHYDLTENNPLGKPFEIQTKLPGVSLENVYQHFTPEQKRDMTIRIVDVIRKISLVRFPSIGQLRSSSPSDNDASLTTKSATVTPESPNSTLRTYLLQKFTDKLYEYQSRNDPFTHYIRQLLLAVENAFKGYTSQGTICLLHPHLVPRNILVDIPPGSEGATDKYVISGVLDWDGAQAAPVEVAYTVPTWLWQPWLDERSEDSNNPPDEDPDLISDTLDQDLKSLKRLFERRIEKIVPGFMSVVRAAYSRRIKSFYQLAQSGFDSHVDLELAKAVIEQFNGRFEDHYA